MEISIPIRLEYKTHNAVPINEVVDSLQAMNALLSEAAQTLPNLVSGLEIKSTHIGIQEVSTGSLKELYLLVLYAAFQKDLDEHVPDIIEKLTGKNIPDEFEALVVLSLLIIVYYGASFVKDMVSDTARDTPIRRQLTALIGELSDKTGKSPDDIRTILDERYKPQNRLKELASTTVKFFRPSKSQSNAPIGIGQKTIDKSTVADAPESYAYEEAAKIETAKPYSGITLELHQMDKDREKSGWAAIPKGLHEKRLMMKLMDGVAPEQLWGRDSVVGDIMLLSKRSGLDFVPSEIHLQRIDD